MEKKLWIPEHCSDYIEKYAKKYETYTDNEIDKEIHDLAKQNRDIHEKETINLDPATNIMNPRAEALLSSGLGNRPSLGYPGDKYERGLEAIEKIEIITSQLACEVFNARYAEIRLGSGALANLYSFMATTKPGDKIIVPPASIGGHVTHHMAGAAGLYGLEVHEAPIDAQNYTIDVDALREQVRKIKPKLLTIGGSLNLFTHPVRQMREIADEFGCYLHFDAAHLSGLIAGKAWQQPLQEGAHILTFSTYKSLGGPPSGLILTNDDELAERIDKIAFPGLTANFDVAKSASLAITLLDWKEYGSEYAQTMIATAKSFASALNELGIPVFLADKGATTSHQFAFEAKNFGGGQNIAKLLREANILTCGIGLPIASVENDLNGLRIGTPEIVRWGMKPDDMPKLAQFIKEVLIDKVDPQKVAKEVTSLKEQFSTLSFMKI